MGTLIHIKTNTDDASDTAVQAIILAFCVVYFPEREKQHSQCFVDEMGLVLICGHD